MSDYIPVDCALHSELELAIMQNTQTEVCWKEPDERQHRNILSLIDLNTHQGEEYLIAETLDHQPLTIRLDRIIAFKLLR
jgi:transcriptional antiterminator Rof (Rho-off)